MTTLPPITHDELTRCAERYLLKSLGCAFAFRELNTAALETPDAIGFKDGGSISILIECKVSRADFCTDKKKRFRQCPEKGMGAYRFYMAPDGVLTKDDMPAGWGLIVVTRRGTQLRARQIVGPKGNTWSIQPEWQHEHNQLAEMWMMASALRRLHLRGRIPEIYEGRKG